jgi:signal transduction histidine kinase
MKKIGKSVFETHHKDKASLVFPVEIQSTYLEYKGKEYICAFARNITERKKMKETLLQSEKLKSLGAITAGVAHEFNNILAVMIGSAEVLEGGFKDDSELKKGLSAIIKAGDDGAEIAKRMLAFASTGEDTSDYTFFDIKYLIKEAIDFTMPRWKNMAQSKGINYYMITEGMEEVPEVLCNPTESREVFINMINNAMDAMPEVTGYDVIKALNGLDKRPKIVLITGWDEKLTFEEGELEPDFIVINPFRLLELARQINDLFNAEQQ